MLSYWQTDNLSLGNYPGRTNTIRSVKKGSTSRRGCLGGLAINLGIFKPRADCSFYTEVISQQMISFALIAVVIGIDLDCGLYYGFNAVTTSESSHHTMSFTIYYWIFKKYYIVNILLFIG